MHSVNQKLTQTQSSFTHQWTLEPHLTENLTDSNATDFQSTECQLRSCPWVGVRKLLDLIKTPGLQTNFFY